MRNRASALNAPPQCASPSRERLQGSGEAEAEMLPSDVASAHVQEKVADRVDQMCSIEADADAPSDVVPKGTLPPHVMPIEAVEATAAVEPHSTEHQGGLANGPAAQAGKQESGIKSAFAAEASETREDEAVRNRPSALNVPPQCASSSRERLQGSGEAEAAMPPPDEVEDEGACAAVASAHVQEKVADRVDQTCSVEADAVATSDVEFGPFFKHDLDGHRTNTDPLDRMQRCRHCLPSEFSSFYLRL